MIYLTLIKHVEKEGVLEFIARASGGSLKALILW